MYDKNGDNVINVEELRGILEILGYSPTPDEVKTILGKTIELMTFFLSYISRFQLFHSTRKLSLIIIKSLFANKIYYDIRLENGPATFTMKLETGKG